MASTATASQAFAFAISSSSHHNNLHSYHFATIPKTHFSLKPLILIKPQIPISIPTSLRRFGRLSAAAAAAAAFDDLEFENDSATDGDEEEEITESGGRLYVGNLPFSMTSSQLAEVLGEAGSVLNVEIVYDRVTDRSRGFGFVTMGSLQGAKEAIQMFNGTLVGGRTVRVNFPEVPRGGEREVMGAKIRNSYRGFVESPHKIYAGNLSWNLTSENLREAFAEQPGVLSAKVIYEQNSGRSRGFGFVTFDSAENMEYALSSMNGVEVEGRALRLNGASERASVTPTVQESVSESNFDSSEILSNIIY